MLRKSTINYLESELRGYPYLEKDIARVREEILHPWSPKDENVGGGRADTVMCVTEVRATSVINDRRLAQLTRVKLAIEIAYNHTTDEGRKLMDLYYFTKPRTLNLTGVANALHISKTVAYDLRKGILSMLADELGIIH
ncbi:transcriptional regulator [Staphylococcus pseudintermedius]|uniref:transcriptional regulator n=1 Tax=Staphylococcus pseudintermedius TaxID=283734 RepID=UPI0019DD153B|nr:transcriptional regulator [Staphylococcus pseudintermedius]EGQ1646409.1 transcriptional regulator [Staphylococcus pseudintermedius]EGQ4170244.1 transcriptional regulator [Staphylococcus pseudintermedius]EIK0274734.1 transcriptional regulator [Staphylococcus pseudintermedius]EIS6532728.1 transcriptional regulator [Staphylococcus pseudintermedius]EJG5112624.1 transcriptional regulator [Staphylococcus pseudintermedius]